MARNASKSKTVPLVELRRIHVDERLSQETMAFAADVYIKGRKVGYADNNGHGGSTNVRVPVTPDNTEAFAKFADTLVVEWMHVYRVHGDRKGITVCCNAETAIDQLTNARYCKACKENVHAGYMDGEEVFVVDYLVEKYRDDKHKAKVEKKNQKIDRAECTKNDARGRLTMRYSVKTPKGDTMFVWPSFGPGEDPATIAAELDKQYNATGEWKVVS